MPINHDASFVDTLPRNVAVQFLERVEKSAANEAFRYPDGDSWTSVTVSYTHLTLPTILRV